MTKNTLNVTRCIQRSLMYILLELLEYQLVGLLSAFHLIAISSSESASMNLTSFTDCEYVTCLWAAITTCIITIQSWEAVVERVSEYRPIVQCKLITISSISWSVADQLSLRPLTTFPATATVKIKYIWCWHLVTDLILECTAMILSTIFNANMTPPRHTPRCQLLSTTAPSPSSRL